MKKENGINAPILLSRSYMKGTTTKYNQTVTAVGKTLMGYKKGRPLPVEYIT